MKILLFGKNGQVGWELQRSLALLGDVIALDRYSIDYCGDLSNLSGVRDTILNIQPAVIVNAAAYTAVDRAEEDVESACKINASAPAVMAKAAQEINALLIHYSTDYVYGGVGDKPWRESDPVSPQNIYGVSKLEGDNAVVKSGCQHLIFRTSWVYAAHGRNFLKTMIELAKSRTELKIINDQYGAPTGAELIADVTAYCISRFSKNRSGIYHLAAAGVTTWYDYAQFIFMSASKQKIKLLVGSETVKAVSSSEFETIAKRPLNSRLCCEKLRTQFGLYLPNWQLGVERTLIELSER